MAPLISRAGEVARRMQVAFAENGLAEVGAAERGRPVLVHYLEKDRIPQIAASKRAPLRSIPMKVEPLRSDPRRRFPPSARSLPVRAAPDGTPWETRRREPARGQNSLQDSELPGRATGETWLESPSLDFLRLLPWT